MTNKAKPDLRVRSAGAAGVYAFQPLSEAGKQFVDGVATTIKTGRWVEGTPGPQLTPNFTAHFLLLPALLPYTLVYFTTSFGTAIGAL